MNIELRKFTIRDIVNGYKDESEEGVFGYGRKLNIRPPYQREFVYDDKKRNAVIDTIHKGFPINVMYWVEREDGTFEVMDGQQRTLSFCQYYHGDFSINNRYFFNLSEEERNQFLDYELFIYVCNGTNDEKLEWFKTINVACEKLTDQELRNAVYTGEWLNDAKRHFSKTSCPAYKLSSKYLTKSPIRQELLATVLNWISDGDIEGYMASHQHDEDCEELWDYFTNVIEWVESVFVDYYTDMKNLEWGKLYNKYHTTEFDSEKIANMVRTLMEDDDVLSKKGIFEYVLDRDVKHLNIRSFRDSEIKAVYKKQEGKCADCGKEHSISELTPMAIVPWIDGGHIVGDNLKLVCTDCNK